MTPAIAEVADLSDLITLPQPTLVLPTLGAKHWAPKAALRAEHLRRHYALDGAAYADFIRAVEARAGAWRARVVRAEDVNAIAFGREPEWVRARDTAQLEGLRRRMGW